MGEFLVIKLVKPTKAVCSGTPYQGGVRQLLLSKTKPHIGSDAYKKQRTKSRRRMLGRLGTKTTD
jgi:hypothetical protein